MSARAWCDRRFNRYHWCSCDRVIFDGPIAVGTIGQTRVDAARARRVASAMRRRDRKTK